MMTVSPECTRSRRRSAARRAGVLAYSRRAASLSSWMTPYPESVGVTRSTLSSRLAMSPARWSFMRMLLFPDHETGQPQAEGRDVGNHHQRRDQPQDVGEKVPEDLREAKPAD